MKILFTRTSRVAIDFIVMSLAFWLAFLLRFDWDLPHQMLKRGAFLWPYVVGLQGFWLLLLDVPKSSWRFVGMREAQRIVVALSAATAVLVATRFGSAAVIPVFGYAQYALMPLGVILINFVLAVLGVSGVRLLRRSLVERSELHSHEDSAVQAIPTLLIGAGQAGFLIAKEITRRPDLGLAPVGFLDDNPGLKGTLVNGVPVLGKTDDLGIIKARLNVEQALITIASATGADIRRITKLCEAAGIRPKIIPGLSEIVGGGVSITRIRDVAIEDLLRREPVVLEEDAIMEAVRDRVVLVSGAGGSIGAELCRQLCRFKPTRVILLERSEPALYEIDRTLRARFPDQEIEPCVGDVTDRSRLEALFSLHSPAVVFHAAAHKHVPMLERNPGEAIKNNVLGTKTLADMACASGVERFVMISTDKAVNPTSVMGASKRVAEMYIQTLSARSKTSFVAVRFGNVLGSSGSVVPLFKAQIERGGPVTVTHPDVKRYFMTIPEACQLVLQAFTLGTGGEIFVLDMGEPVLILDMAKDLISLSGLKPEDDIPIVFSGLRPGEKLFEELALSDENADTTRHSKIFVGRIRVQDFDEIERSIEALVAIADKAGTSEIRAKLKSVVPEYRPEPTEEPEAQSPTPESEATERA
jgi:FlaA1/EpsC-like NDP-sugar epimerase